MVIIKVIVIWHSGSGSYDLMVYNTVVNNLLSYLLLYDVVCKKSMLFWEYLLSFFMLTWQIFNLAIKCKIGVLLVYKVRWCSIKKVFLKISQNTEENTCMEPLFLIKFQAKGLQLNKKWVSGIVGSLWILPKFLRRSLLQNICKRLFLINFWIWRVVWDHMTILGLKVWFFHFRFPPN